MRNSKTIFLCSLVVIIFDRCGSRSENDRAHSGESYLSLTDNGAWCWFSDPRAIYFEGKHRRTYAGWVDSAGSIMVGFYDHDLKSIETKALRNHLEKDDHNNPSLFIDNEGKLMVFYSKHDTQEPIYMDRARNAEDISAWDPVDELGLNDSVVYAGLSNTYTYTNICQLADEENKLYLFWRGADHKPNFSTSVDNGKNWDRGKILILPDRIYKDRRPYLKMASNNKDVIHFAFTDGHPREEVTNSIYYSKYYKGAFYKANGDKIADWSGLPLKPQNSDVVYDAVKSGEKAWIWDVAENGEGDPVIVYSRFPNDSTHVYYYSVWDHQQWSNHALINSGRWFPQTRPGEIEREPNYSGGIVLDHEDPSTVYLSRVENGKFEIEKWATRNQGKDWNILEMTKNSEFDNVRPFVIRNHATQDSLTVLWLNVKKYRHYTDYQTSIKMNIR